VTSRSSWTASAVSPRRFAAAFIGRRGIGADERSANVKHVRIDGVRAGRPIRLTYDFAVETIGHSASSTITGTVAAIAADIVARGGGRIGVHAPEAAFEPRPFLDALALRGLTITEQELAR
jgi:saccharopine dehydrogenase-like NADP-dependent oxidoreductase